MGDIQSRAAETYQAPNGETLVRGDYSPTSYAGTVQVAQCPECETFTLIAGDAFQQQSKDPYFGYCNECEKSVTFQGCDQ